MNVEQTVGIDGLKQDWLGTPYRRRGFALREPLGKIFGVLARTDDGRFILNSFDTGRFEEIGDEQVSNWFFRTLDIRVQGPGQTRDEYFTL